MAETFDLIVIGGGSAGYAAARTATEMGAHVAVVEQGPLGGLCILRGCMPSKTILASSNRYYRVQHAEELGIHVGQATADLGAIIARKRRLVKEFADYRIQELTTRAKLTLIMGKASFMGPHEITVGDRILSAPKIIIATGSTPFVPKVPGLAEAGYLTSDEALELEEPPASLAILGGGPVALELGQFYARIGVQVHLIQRSTHVLSHEDDEVGATLEQYLREDGMDIYCGTQLQSCSVHNGNKKVSFLHRGKEAVVTADEIFVATGRRPRIADLNLAAAGVAGDETGIPVDAQMRTSNPHIFAVGDVTKLYDIVHVAIQQGEIAAYNALSSGPSRYMDYRVVPFILFTDPQFGRVGLSEREARAKHLPVVTAAYAFADHGKAMCLAETRGFVKMVAHAETGEILGYQILGPEGGELLHECTVALHFRCTAQQFARIPHYHPTLAEILTYPAENIAARIQRSAGQAPAR